MRQQLNEQNQFSLVKFHQTTDFDSDSQTIVGGDYNIIVHTFLINLYLNL